MTAFIPSGLTDEDILTLKKLNDEGKVVEAYQYLADKGDQYAKAALPVVQAALTGNEPTGLMDRFFQAIVKIHWNNVTPGAYETLFSAVAGTFQANYLALLVDKDGNKFWPITEQIEQAYRDAVVQYHLPPLIAIDGIISRLDLFAGSGGAADFTWAWFLGINNLPFFAVQGERIKYDVKVFEDLTTVQCLRTFVADGLALVKQGLGSSTWEAGKIAIYLAAPFASVTAETIYNKFLDFTDQIGLYGLFMSLDSDFLTVPGIERIVKASAISDETTLKATLDALGKIFNLPTANVENRTYYYNTLENWLKEIELSGPKGKFVDLTNKSSGELMALATSDIAYRYALKELNPFAVLGADYDIHNQSGELNLAKDGGEITEQYLADRAQFLSGVIEANTKDTGSGKNLRADTGGEPIYFEDKASGITLQTQNSGSGQGTSGPNYRFGGADNDTFFGTDQVDHLYGGAGMDRLDGGKGNDYVEGNSGSDILTGGEGADALLGGAGDDILEGGKGSDSLNGGLGNDTYIFTSGDGWDTLEDKDGLGHIEYDGVTLTGGEAVGDSGMVWQSTANGKTFTYILGNWTEMGETFQRLSIQGPDGGLFVKNWSAGQLGLSLPGTTPPTVIATPLTTADDIVHPADTNATAIDGLAGNDILVSYEQSVALKGGLNNDLLFGGAGDDTLDGGDGNDFLNGGAGHDLIQGGSGNDFVTAGNLQDLDLTVLSTWAGVASRWTWSRNNTLNYDGNSATLSIGAVASLDGQALLFTTPASLDAKDTSQGDIISGGIGNDVLAGSEGTDIISGEADDDILFGNGGADILLGGDGNDQIVGGAGINNIEGGIGNDILLGGYEDDILDGGTGDDVLTGDLPNLSGTQAPPSAVDLNRFGKDTLRGGAGNDQLFGGGKDDLLYGGDDNDKLYGEADNDTLYGDAGSDKLYGGAGNDELHGGEGDDRLEGDVGTAAAGVQGDDTLYGDLGNDTLIGAGGADRLYGGEGDDQLYGDADDVAVALQGNDFLDGGAGNDYLRGYGGNDSLLGGVGGDELHGDDGDDTLDGGDGDDLLYGEFGNDTLIARGSSGIAQLAGGAGDDIYRIGAANVTICDHEGNNRVVLENLATITDLIASGALLSGVRYGLLTYGSTTTPNQVLLQDILLDGGTTTVVAVDGTEMSYSALCASTYRQLGSDGNDLMTGLRDSDTLEGGAGDDRLYGKAGNDVLIGSGGNDRLLGGSGNDVLDGGPGNDVLDGGPGDQWVDGAYYDTTVPTNGSCGNDTYLFGRGDGQDRLISYRFDLTAGKLNTLQFKAGVGVTDIVVRRVGQSADLLDAEFSIVGTNDKITVGSFFERSGLPSAVASNPIQQVRFADGTIWDAQAIAAMVLLGTPGDDNTTGTPGNDLITGAAGNDWLYGEAGNDILDGGTGNDWMYGGTGDDVFRFGRGDGTDTIGSDYQRTSSVNTAGKNNTLELKSGVAPADLVLSRSPNGWDLLVSIAGTNDSLRVEFFFYNDDPSIGQNPIQYFKFQDGTVWDISNIVSRAFMGSEISDVLRGTIGDDVITGEAGNDGLVGMAGNDLLDGGTGTDFLDGSEGNDILRGGGGDDTLIGGYGNDIIDGGAGNDVLRGGKEWSEDSGSDTFLFGKGDGQDVISDFLSNSPEEVNVLAFKAGVSPTEVLVRRVAVEGGPLRDLELSIAGTTDTLTIMYYFDAPGTPKVIRFDDGTIWNETTIINLAGSANHAPALGVPLLNAWATEGVAFSATLPLGSFTDSDAGDQLIYSAKLSDGSSLPAWLAFDGATQTFHGTAGASNLGGLQIVVTATDSGGLNVSGDFRLDVLAHNAVNLMGTSGNDLLSGFSGADTLNGGVGGDTMVGGGGNDTYIVDNAGDVITERLNEGTDLVQSAMTYTLAANVENLTLSGTAAINGIGNALGNILIGNSASNMLTGGDGNDTLDGGAGNDTMVGGLGDDVYVVNVSTDVVTEAAGAGNDTIQSAITLTLANNVENLLLTGTTAINGTGNTLDNTLIGNAGNNTLSGGIGSDTLIGGAGNDTYVVDNAADITTEWLNEGIDLVQSSVTYTLAANLENLTLTGTTAINGTGNALGNVLAGNGANNTLAGGAGNDTLSGGAGADTMIGAIGNDTYVVDNTADVITENASEGTDLVQSSVTYILATNVENLSLTGTMAINGTGNALDNILIGNSANNTLTGGNGNDTIDGGTGNDTMVGGLGDDVYVVNVSTDVVTEAANAGNDTVQSAVTMTLTTNVENLLLTGTTAINGTGNILNNLVRGNTAINTLNGGTGNDILEGGGGNDILTDTSGTALFNGGAGADTITGGAGAEIFLGGLGNDTYTTAGGNDILLFNKGDGQDIFATGGTGNDVISLGGSITYADLTFTKATNDLVLKIGATDQITFKDWYAGTPSKPVAKLQMIAEAMADFAAGGADPLKDQKVENFNFAGLAGAFDAARVANSGLTSWALTNALTSFQMAGSDTAALGGDLAYQYGKNGTLAGIGVTPALATLSDTNLGTTAQTQTPLAGLQTGSVRLS